MKTKNNIYFIPSDIKLLIENKEKPPQKRGFSFRNKGIPILFNHLIHEYYVLKKQETRLSSTVLKEVLGNNYTKAIKWMVEEKYIKLCSDSSMGTSRTYVINPNSIDAIVPYNINKELKEIFHSNDFKHPLYKQLKTDIQGLRIDIDESKNILSNLRKNELIDDQKYHASMISTYKIHHKDFYIIFDDWKRVHTNITNLKRELRKDTLTTDKGERLMEIDIPNSHPFFFLALIKGKVNENEYQEWKYRCFEGELYSKFSKDKRKAKDVVFSVLYGKNDRNNISDVLFKKEFPDIHSFILKYKTKKKSYKSLCSWLQDIESRFVFNKIYGEIKTKLGDECKIITIHDAVACQESRYADCLKIYTNQINNFKSIL